MYSISTIAMIVYFALAGLVLLGVFGQTSIVSIIEGIAALVAAVALILKK
jgi:hypothetical protein